MRHRLYACLVLLFLAPPLFAEGPTLKDARERWLKGNYDEARAAYEDILKEKDAKTRAPAAVGLSRALESKGEYDKALEAVETALKDDAKSADLNARRAELLYLRGRWDDALKAVETALGTNKEQMLARWVRAQIYRDKGDVKAADTEVRWFVRYYTQRSNDDKDITDPDELLLVGLAGSENARWNNLSDQFKFILNDVYKDALKSDKNFWPAEYQSGMLLLEKYNRGEAIAAFDNALTINPQAAEAMIGKGIIALEKFEIKDAESLAEQALKINPALPAALQLRADVHLASGDISNAMKELEAARKINPRDEATLGRIAACLLLTKKHAEFEALVKDVSEFDKKPSQFHYELAQRLEDRRRFDEAEKYYKLADEMRPMVPWSRNSLGLLYMRLGREKEGRDALDRAFKADPFNVRVSNMRKVLKHLDKYQTLKTEHFELRYDPTTDKALALYMGDYLEGVYKDLSEKFQFKATGPILVEVFNNHEMFSGRTIALPDLHTIGACTGKMFAMVSPNGKGINHVFNWSRVLRHEMVHIFNLEQSQFQCPHWLTEGLAVINEGFPRPQQWNQLLKERVPAGELMNLDDVDLGFIRPRSPADWHMAYCQSQLYVEYMKSKFGPQTVGEMLNAYRDGLDTDAAIQKVCKVSKAEFEKGYKAHLEEVVKSIKGKAAEKKMTFNQLKDAHEKDPNDADISARLALAQLTRDKKQARELAEAVLKAKPKHPLASYVKAKLLQNAGDEPGAKELLEGGLDPANPEPKVLLELGKLYYDASEFAKAAQVYEIGRKAEPYSMEWLLQLARVYAQSGEKDKQIGVLKDLVPMDADDLEHRKRLAKLLLDEGNFAEAEKYAREAIEIDIRDGEMREALLKALEGQKKDAEVEKLKAIFQ